MSSTNPVRITIEAAGGITNAQWELNRGQTADVPIGALLCLDKESETRYRIGPMGMQPPLLSPEPPLTGVLKKRPRVDDLKSERASKRLRCTNLETPEDVVSFVVNRCTFPLI